MSWFARLSAVLGPAAITLALLAAAVCAAELGHFALAHLRDEPFGLRETLDVAGVTVLVVAPLLVVAQKAIAKREASRRALRRMTERLAIAVDSAEQANIAKTHFLANMSHELRTPLNAIIGFSELIQAQKLGPIGHERYLEYVRDINQSGLHLLRIINDILDLAKIDSGRIDTRDEDEFKVAAVVDAALRMIRPLAERQGVALVAGAIPHDIRLLAVERLVSQILLNLLSNAVKFTPSGGRVSVAGVRAPDGGLTLVVSDTGLGMTAAEISVALTPFGQVDSALSRKHQGTGLGLPLAKAMMEMHGGTLLVTSQPGKGTAVTLTFPRERVSICAPACVSAGSAAIAPVEVRPPVEERRVA